jgi:hypothetical protein
VERHVQGKFTDSSAPGSMYASQRRPAGGLWATSDPRPLVAKPEELLIKLILVITSAFTFFAPKKLKKL